MAMIPNPSQRGLIARDSLATPVAGPTQARQQPGRNDTSGGPFAVGQPQTTPPIMREIATPMPAERKGGR